MAVKPIPDGYHTITPALVAEGADAVLEFLKKVFGATELMVHRHANGTIWHSELQIGDSRIMLSEANEQFKGMPAAFSLYVEDVDAAYRRGTEAGGVSLREPADQFYGDRTGGVRDPAGNQWWISTHVEDVATEEMERRMKAAEGSH
jgi:PhnB protein